MRADDRDLDIGPRGPDQGHHLTHQVDRSIRVRRVLETAHEQHAAAVLTGRDDRRNLVDRGDDRDTRVRNLSEHVARSSSVTVTVTSFARTIANSSSRSAVTLAPRAN